MSIVLRHVRECFAALSPNATLFDPFAQVERVGCEDGHMEIPDRATADQNLAHARNVLHGLTRDVAKTLAGGADEVDVWVKLSRSLADTAPDAEFLAVVLAAAVVTASTPR